MKRRITYISVLCAMAGMVIGAAWVKNYYDTEQLRFVRSMGAGINIGNTLDATGLREYRPDAGDWEYETFWGNPEIQGDLFSTIREAGFSTVRIPVTWEDHLDEENRISEEWMNRVQEVVDMALAQDLYVIINTHHEKWLDLQIPEEEILTKFHDVWEQIAIRFQEYDDKLLYEGMNEPRLRESPYEWTSGTKELQDMVNRLNQEFVDTVRSTGGWNAERYVLVCPYASNNQREAMEALVVPEGNVIVSIHMYVPYSFCQDASGTAEWNSQLTESANEIKTIFENMEQLYIDKGIPALITEFGCCDKKNQESRQEWVRFYKEQAKKAGIGCIWWDNGSNYRILNRENNTWTYPELVEELVK